MRSRSYCHLLLVALLAVVANSAAAQEESASDPPGEELELGEEDLAPGTDELFEVDPVVVTASRRQERLSEATVATEVITREDLRSAGVQDASEALEELTGLEIIRSFRGNTVRLQGLDADYVLVLVDGERTIGRTGGGIDLSRFPVETIERIEIVRGASSALYGSDAIGGVINIITRDNVSSYSVEAQAQYGYMIPPDGGDDAVRDFSFGDEAGHLFDLSVAGGARLGILNVQLSAGYHHSGSYDLEPENIATSGSAFDEYIFTNRTSLDLSDTLSAVAQLRFRRRDSQGIDESGTGAIFDREQVAEEFAASLGPRFEFEDGSKFRISLGYSLYRDQFLQDQRGSDALDQFQDNREHQGEGQIQLDWVVSPAHVVTAGADYLLQVLDSPRVNGSRRRARVAPYIQDEWIIMDDPYLVIVPGFRLDIDTQFGVQPSPKLAIRFDPHERVTLRASGGAGFRAPTFAEQYLFFENPSVGYVVEGNTELDPESSWSVQVGTVVRPTDRIWISANLFRNQIENLIDAQPLDDGNVGRLRFVYTNVAAAHTQGLELTVRYRPLDELDLEVGYALLDARDEELDRALPGRAMHRGTFKGRVRTEAGLEAELRGAIVGERPFYFDLDGDGTEEEVTDDPYAQVDAKFGWRFGDRFGVYVGIDNVFNVGSRDLNVRPRTVYGGLTGALEQGPVEDDLDEEAEESL
ncbi:MAG: TonB-dependent receptor [Myxococcota bacterium]